MAEGWLDFEQPLADLVTRMEELAAIGAKDEVKRLQEQIDKQKAKLYSDLTPCSGSCSRAIRDGPIPLITLNGW